MKQPQNMAPIEKADNGNEKRARVVEKTKAQPEMFVATRTLTRQMHQHVEEQKHKEEQRKKDKENVANKENEEEEKKKTEESGRKEKNETKKNEKEKGQKKVKTIKEKKEEDKRKDGESSEIIPEAMISRNKQKKKQPEMLRTTTVLTRQMHQDAEEKKHKEEQRKKDKENVENKGNQEEEKNKTEESEKKEKKETEKNEKEKGQKKVKTIKEKKEEEDKRKDGENSEITPEVMISRNEQKKKQPEMLRATTVLTRQMHQHAAEQKHKEELVKKNKENVKNKENDEEEMKKMEESKKKEKKETKKNGENSKLTDLSEVMIGKKEAKMKQPQNMAPIEKADVGNEKRARVVVKAKAPTGEFILQTIGFMTLSRIYRCEVCWEILNSITERNAHMLQKHNSQEVNEIIVIGD